ncbi:MAG: hypothetical protein R2697_19365 [Ilumatobacteraceae bacterium]
MTTTNVPSARTSNRSTTAWRIRTASSSTSSGRISASTPSATWTVIVSWTDSNRRCRRVGAGFDVGDDRHRLVDAETEVLDLVDAEAEIGGQRRSDGAHGRRVAVMERQVELDDVDLGCDVAVPVEVGVHGGPNLQSPSG